RMAADPALPIATIAAPLLDEVEWRSPHVVKVVADTGGRALYFSRSPVPFAREAARAPDEPLGWRHVGMYAYRRDVLLRLAALPPSPLERRERLPAPPGARKGGARRAGGDVRRCGGWKRGSGGGWSKGGPPIR